LRLTCFLLWIQVAGGNESSCREAISRLVLGGFESQCAAPERGQIARDEMLRVRPKLIFIAPGAKQERFVFPAVGSGLRLQIGEIDTAFFHPHPDRYLRGQPDGQE